MDHHTITIDQNGLTLTGDLNLPPAPAGLVLFAHGSGSSRLSTRNRAVARHLNNIGLGTVLFDLLTADEERIDARTAQLRFDIPLLARRLTGAVDWLSARPTLATLPLGLFGASTGAAAALITSGERPRRVAAVVSRGGRPDLAQLALERVRAPTLLIVGGDDREVLALNRQALAALGAHGALHIVPGATHLFEEPGALEQVARLAGDWFLRHM